MSFKDLWELTEKFEKETCDYTALVRDKKSGAYSIKRVSGYHNMKELSDDLRGNGFRVTKIFKGNVSDIEVADWHFYNRK